MVTPADYRLIVGGLRFPEAPVWMNDGSLLVVEVEAGRLTRVAPAGTKTIVAETGGGPNGAAIGPDGRCYICNNGGMQFREKGDLLSPGLFDEVPGSIQAVDLNTGAVETLYDSCDGVPLSAPNDLVFDTDGGIWFTDHGKVLANLSYNGALYYARADGDAIVRVLRHLHGPNGVGLSPDGRQLHVSETPTGRVWTFEVGGPGELRKVDGAPLAGRGRLLVGLPGYQMFDSLTVDSAGWVLVATLMNGGLTAISPDGAIVRHVPLPDRLVTNACFGGPDMRTLFVTLSMSGKLVAFEWERPGFTLNHAG